MPEFLTPIEQYIADQDAAPTAEELATNPVRTRGLYHYQEELLSGGGGRPILLGMNNPVSSNPDHALYPHPPNCAGWRLWKMSGLSEDEYFEKFERRNLLNGRAWSPQLAAVEAEKYRAGMDKDRRIVLLGEDVCRLMWHSSPAFVWRRGLVGGWWAKFPHPSGRNLMWNDPMYRKCAELFLQELAQ